MDNEQFQRLVLRALRAIRNSDACGTIAFVDAVAELEVAMANAEPARTIGGYQPRMKTPAPLTPPSGGSSVSRPAKGRRR